MDDISYDEIAEIPHRLKVLAYNSKFLHHECQVAPNGPFVRVDLMVDGSFGDEVKPENLIGKTVQVDCTDGYLWLAHNVRVIE